MNKKTLFSFLFLLIAFATNAQKLKDCSTCAKQAINEAQLKGLSIDDIRLLTNDLYARKGYHFENSSLQSYFEEKSWYKSKNDNSKIVLTDIEKKNIQLFQEKTTEIKAVQQELVKQLKAFKKSVLENKKAELKSTYGFFYEQPNDTIEPQYLKTVFNKINLDDINYYKNKGLNRVTTDNGIAQLRYEVNIENEVVEISYNFMSPSELSEGGNVFYGAKSENEHAYIWQFEFKNNTLKFIRFIIVG